MRPKQKQNRIAKIITLIFISNFIFANFAFAAAPTVSITADTTLVNAGGPVTITWNASPPPLTILLQPYSVFNSNSPSGTITVNPTVTTAYTIIATNSSGQRSESSVTVRVNGTSGTPDPSTATSITPDDEKKAQTDKAACLDFSNKVYNVTKQTARAVWNGALADGGCFIVPGNYGGILTSDNITASADNRPPEYANFQNQIRNGNGITQAVFVAAQQRYNESKNNASGPSVIIGEVLVFVGGVVNTTLAGIAAMAGGIFTTAVDPIINIGKMPTVVDTGWKIVRDVCNMFFILIMIIIALAAILRIEEYDYKHLLGKLILMAILVNFSQIIAVTIMNTVNFLAAVFWSGPNVDLWHIFVTMMKVANPASDFNIVLTGGTPAALALVLGKFAFTVVATVVFIALAAMFIIRLVGLYVLIIFSPIAYVARIIPATEKYSEEWWSHFLKYLIWAPIALFMLRLTMLVVDNDSQFNPVGGGNHDTVFVFFILAAFMAAALLLAEEAGMVGGKMIVEGVKHGAEWVGHRAAHFAGRKWNEATSHMVSGGTGRPTTTGQRIAFALLNPVAAFKGYSKRGEELAHHAQEEAIARGREGADLLLGGATLPHAQIVRRAQENQQLKSLVSMRKEQLADIMVKFEDMKGHEGEVMRNAAFTAMLANGFTDDILRMKHFADKYGEVRDKLDENNKVIGKELVTYTPQIINRFSHTYLGGPEGHMTEQSLRILAEDAEKYGKDTGHPEVVGHAVFDTDAAGGKGGFINTMEESSATVQNMRGDNMPVLINDPDAKFSQHKLSIGELVKGGGRTTINTATHGMQPQVADLRTSVDASGNIKVEGYAEVEGKMLNNSMHWGAIDAAPEAEAFYGGVMKVVGSPQGMREVQHAQQRVRDGLLGAQMDEQGRLIFKTRNEVRKLIKNIQHASDLARGLYAQQLGVVADRRGDIPNITFKVGETGPVEGIDFNGKKVADADWATKPAFDEKTKQPTGETLLESIKAKAR